MHDKIIFYLGMGMGDIAVSLNGVKRYKQNGARTVIILNGIYKEVFENIDFVDKFLYLDTCLNSKIFDNDRKNTYTIYTSKKSNERLESIGILAQSIEEQFKKIEDIQSYSIAFGRQGIITNYIKEIASRLNIPLIKSKQQPPVILSLVEKSLLSMGLDPCKEKPIFKYTKTNLSLKKGFKIGIGIGSEFQGRRLSLSFVNQLCSELIKNGYKNIYLFGHIRHNEKSFINNNLYSYTQYNLRDCFTALSQMDIFISTDCGLGHASIFMNIPYIVLQGRELIESSFCDVGGIYPIMTDESLLLCNRMCKCKHYEKYGTDGTNIFFNRLIPISNNTFFDHSKLNIQCVHNSEYSVECLNKTKIQDVLDQVKRLSSTKE